MLLNNTLDSISLSLSLFSLSFLEYSVSTQSILHSHVNQNILSFAPSTILLTHSLSLPFVSPLTIFYMPRVTCRHQGAGKNNV